MLLLRLRMVVGRHCRPPLDAAILKSSIGSLRVELMLTRLLLSMAVSRHCRLLLEVVILRSSISSLQ